jgi:hypothetical protein
VENTNLFTVYGLPKPNITLNLPENDPNAYAIRFSGQVNTGNGPSENLLLIVSSDSGKKANYNSCSPERDRIFLEFYSEKIRDNPV